MRNILFKFAVDESKIFSGNHTFSAKVAGHELKGLKGYFQSQVEGLCYPLVALLDYKGWRLVASSLLPISSSTIVYGSNDAGMTIFNSNESIAKLVLEASEMLNLKPHLCKEKKDNLSKLCATACDVEGHLGRDGRFYLIDLSRVFPPTSPKRSKIPAHLFQLFRVEFLQTHPTPLCRSKNLFYFVFEI